MGFGYTTPKATKRLRCEYCYGPIAKGENYTRWTGIFGGELQSNALHNECQEQMEYDDPYNEGWTPGEADMPDRVRLEWGHWLAWEGCVRAEMNPALAG